MTATRTDVLTLDNRYVIGEEVVRRNLGHLGRTLVDVRLYHDDDTRGIVLARIGVDYSAHRLVRSEDGWTLEAGHYGLSAQEADGYARRGWDL